MMTDQLFASLPGGAAPSSTPLPPLAEPAFYFEIEEGKDKWDAQTMPADHCHRLVLAQGIVSKGARDILGATITARPGCCWASLTHCAGICTAQRPFLLSLLCPLAGQSNPGSSTAQDAIPIARSSQTPLQQELWAGMLKPLGRNMTMRRYFFSAWEIFLRMDPKSRAGVQGCASGFF